MQRHDKIVPVRALLDLFSREAFSPHSILA